MLGGGGGGSSGRRKKIIHILGYADDAKQAAEGNIGGIKSSANESDMRVKLHF